MGRMRGGRLVTDASNPELWATKRDKDGARINASRGIYSLAAADSHPGRKCGTIHRIASTIAAPKFTQRPGDHPTSSSGLLAAS